MAKQIGSTSYVPLTLAQLTEKLASAPNLPIHVSKGWLRSIESILGTAPTEVTEAPEKGEDEPAAPEEKKGKLHVVED